MTEIIIDCDPGVDDALALALAVASEELTLRFVTCVAGNRPVETTSLNARRLLDLFGATDIPVYAGASRSLAYSQPRCSISHGEDGLGGVFLEAKGVVCPDHAADKLAEALRASSAGKLTVVAVGPLTNLALVEIMQPGLLARAQEILIMGGTAFVPGNVNPAAEFNFWSDPLSAQAVLESGARLRMFGLDVTQKAAMNQRLIAEMAASGSRSQRLLSEMLRVYGQSDPLLHDICPVAYLLEPKLFRGQRGHMQVDWAPGIGEGRSYFWPETFENRPGMLNVTAVTDVHNASLLSIVQQRLSALP